MIFQPDQFTPPIESILQLVDEFRGSVPSIEAESNLPFILLQDGRSQAYYLECHVKSSDAVPLVDLDAALEPEEQEQFRLQRDLQVTNPAFLRMCADAIGNRQFSDIIAEYDPSYRPETPLKILGGQHRVEAVRRALESDKVKRYHGFRIYFGLTVDQRNEIAQVANTNIAISPDLLDRMEETVRGPQLRDFCHDVGLLDLKEDFADRKNPDGKITVRLARTFIVNFFAGKEQRKTNRDETAYMPYVCKSGEQDPSYLEIAKKNKWKDVDLMQAGSQFATLHKKQLTTIMQEPDLDNAEFRTKAVSMAVLSSWAFTAGLLQGDQSALAKLYSLPVASGSQDPLNAKAMTESRHPTDPATYRGLGTRYSPEDRGRVTELFIQYSNAGTKVVTKKLIESAIMTYEAKVAVLKAKKAKEKVT